LLTKEGLGSTRQKKANSTKKRGKKHNAITTKAFNSVEAQNEATEKVIIK